jgi:phage-related protein
MAQSVGEVALDIVAGKNTLNNTIRKSMGEAQGVANSGSSGISNALGKIGSVASAVGKTVAVGIGVASTAVVAMGKSAVSAYADYEQLVGGVETLMGTKGAKTVEEYAEKVGQSVDYVKAEFEMLQQAQSNAMTNAQNAYKDAGLSMNEYMETINGMASALNQCTASELETVEYANKAVIAMSDNANKMGTSMESIQNAYAGFTKQNFTMLDNLKLGYGGTKEEMQRLLKDAEAISGIKYDISSYADIIDAICTIQKEMGIAGATADEAKKTISGSIGMMKASWQNLITGMGDDTQDFGALIDNFVESVDIVGANLLPRIEVVLGGVVKLVQGLAPKIIARIPDLMSQLLPSIITASEGLLNSIISVLPSLIDMLVNDVIPQLLSGILSITEALIEALPSVMQSICSALPTLLPLLINGLVSLIITLCENFNDIIQPVLEILPDLIISVVDSLMENLPILIEGCVSLVVGIVSALPEIIFSLVDAMPTVLVSIVGGLLNALPILLNGWKQIWNEVKKALSTYVTEIKERAVEGFKLLKDKAIEIFNQFKAKCSEIFNSVKEKIMTPITNAKERVVDTFQNLKTNVTTKIDSLRLSVTEKFNTIKDKIVSPIENAKEKIRGIIDTIKGFFSNMTLSFPHIKLPHFSISPSGWKIGDLLKGSIPKLSISWYQKAMKNPILMNKPTIFGYDAGSGKLLGGGEAGSELVVGTNTLLNMIKSAVGSVFSGAKMTVDVPALQNVGARRAGSDSGLSDKMDRLIELFKQFIESGNSDMTVPIYIGNELIDEYILNKNNRNVLRSGGRA